jgi:uncharacterized protein YcfL
MRKLLLGGMLLPLLLAACTDPIPAWQDPLTGRTQVTVTEYWLQDKIRVQPPHVERVGAGQLKVSIEIRSRHDWDLPLDYQYHFYDQAGKQTYVSGWQLVRLPRKGSNTIDFTSMDPAADFSVELRTAK